VYNNHMPRNTRVKIQISSQGCYVFPTLVRFDFGIKLSCECATWLTVPRDTHDLEIFRFGTRELRPSERRPRELEHANSETRF